jgi:hypothetical protein
MFELELHFFEHRLPVQQIDINLLCGNLSLHRLPVQCVLVISSAPIPSGADDLKYILAWSCSAVKTCPVKGRITRTAAW